MLLDRSRVMDPPSRFSFFLFGRYDAAQSSCASYRRVSSLVILSFWACEECTCILVSTCSDMVNRPFVFLISSGVRDWMG